MANPHLPVRTLDGALIGYLPKPRTTESGTLPSSVKFFVGEPVLLSFADDGRPLTDDVIQLPIRRYSIGWPRPGIKGEFLCRVAWVYVATSDQVKRLRAHRWFIHAKREKIHGVTNVTEIRGGRPHRPKLRLV